MAHFSGEQFKALTGISLVHVPYKGAGPAVNDLIGGRLQFMFENLPTVLPHVRSGKLKALAVGTKTHSVLLPESPTMIEAGVPGFEASTAFGVLSPAKTPAPVVGRLNQEIVKILLSPDIRERLLAQGLEPAGGKVVTHDATYTRPYQAHASMGPSCAVAQVKDGKYMVWTHSQGVFPLRRELNKVLGVPEANITCTHVEGAGCYGHNGADDVALDAILVARATGGRPVKLQWMRDDEFSWEPYGSAMVMKMRARLDESGSIVDWRHEVWSHPHNTRPISNPGGNLLAGWHLAKPVSQAPSPNIPQPAGGADRNAVPTYDFSGQQIVLHYITDVPIRTSALRTLGAYANVFALESFMDEMAAAAGADPVAFRLRHMKDPRARAVIEECARRAGWKPNQKGDGTHGRGFAYSRYKNLACYVAVVADVTVDRRTGKVRVTKAVSAVDAGLIINPDGIVDQIEGGIIQSASWTLKEHVGFDRQRITTRSWADYPILTFPEVPAVEVHLINRPDERSLGTGEGSQGPTVAAIANAVANATGARIRDLPFSPKRVKAAIA